MGHKREHLGAEACEVDAYADRELREVLEARLAAVRHFLRHNAHQRPRRALQLHAHVQLRRQHLHAVPGLKAAVAARAAGAWTGDAEALLPGNHCSTVDDGQARHGR